MKIKVKTFKVKTASVNLNHGEIDDLISLLCDKCDAIDDTLCDIGDDDEDADVLNAQLDFYCNLLSKLRKAIKRRK